MMPQDIGSLYKEKGTNTPQGSGSGCGTVGIAVDSNSWPLDCEPSSATIRPVANLIKPLGS